MIVIGFGIACVIVCVIVRVIACVIARDNFILMTAIPK